MRFILFLFILILSVTNVGCSESNNIIISDKNYSVFYEEDAQTIMLVYFDEVTTYGEIVSFGGYTWFEKTYAKPRELIATYIQPDGLGVSGEMESFMLESYLINDVKTRFSVKDGDQILRFTSKDAIQSIVGHLTRNESFTFASLAKNSWYAGTYIPIKEKKDLIELSNKNRLTFCMLIDYIDELSQKKNIKMQHNDIRKAAMTSKIDCS